MMLIELMALLALSNVIAVTAWTLALHLIQSDRQVAAYGNDLLGARRSLRAIERDLRAASSVTTDGSETRIVTESFTVRWKLEAGTLWRGSPQGRRRIASRIDALDVRADGKLVRVALELAARTRVAPRREAVFATMVHMRGREPR